MRNCTILLLILLFFSNEFLFSQWKKFNEGIYGADVKFMTNNADYIFIGNEEPGALYRLKKDEDRWIKINKGLEDKVINCIAVNNYIAIIGTKESGLYISEDNGSTWNIINPGIGNSNISSIQIQGEEIFVYYIGKGIFSSLDNGVTWVDRTEKLSDKNYISTFAFRHDTIIVCSGQSIRWNKLLYISLDNGETWNMKPAGQLIGLTYNQILFYRDYMILPAGEDGVYITSNIGDTWSLLGGEIPKEAKSVSRGIVKDDYILVGTSGFGAMTLKFNINIWEERSNGAFKYNNLIFSSDNYYIYAGAQNDGVFRTSDYGKTWEQLPMIGLEHVVVNDLYKNGDYLLLSSNSVIARTHKDSLSWNVINNNTGINTVKKIFETDSLLLIGTNSGIYRSTNKGETWDSCVNGNGTVSCFVENNGNILVGYQGKRGIKYSKNKGLSWESYKDSIFGTMIISTLLIHDNKIIVGTEDNGIVYSTDSGLKWIRTSLDTNSPSNIRCIAPKENKIYIGSYLKKGVIISDENFSKFEQYQTSTALNELSILDYKYDGENIFAATYQSIYLSQDNGISWRKVTDSLSNIGIKSIEILGDYVYFGSYGNGVYRARIADFPIIGIQEASVKKSLEISPNPVYTNSTISFNLETDTQVSISISDIFGNEVAKLLNNEFYSSGSHSLQFNSAGLSSGVYFCTMRAGDIVAMRKFVVVE